MAMARLITVGPAAGDDVAARMVARALLSEGLPVASRQVVDEDEAALGPALETAVAAPGLVVVLDVPGGSGGEVVRRVLARLAGVRLVLDDKLLALLEDDFSRRGRAMPRRLDRLGLLPQGSELWPALAGPPGFALEVRGATVVVLPHGAASLEALVDERLRPLSRQRLGREVALLRTLHTTGLTPTDAEERLGAWLGRDSGVLVSTTVADGDVSVRLLARGPSRGAVERELLPIERAVRAALGDECYGSDGASLESVVGALLTERGLTVAVAESCTGGLVGHRLAALPGASRWLGCGVTVDSNRAAARVLGVPDGLLAAHGGVSAAVAEAMAVSVRRIAGSECGLAVTGVAGNDGATHDTPAGTVYIGCVVAAPSGTPRVDVRRFHVSGDRDAIRWQASQVALDTLRRVLARRPPPIS